MCLHRDTSLRIQKISDTILILGITFSRQKGDTKPMNLFGFIVILSLAIIFPSLNQSDAQAQVSSNINSSAANATLFDQFLTKGNALFHQGKYQEALSDYDKALSFNPTNIGAIYNKALTLDELGRISEAIASYEKVLDITPNDTGALNNLGLDFDNLGNHIKAISYYDKVLAISPDDTDALYNKGLAYDSLGMHDKAVFYYRNVFDIDPTDVDALNKLNLTYNNLNKTQINVIQQIDKTSLFVVVGLFIVLAGAVIVIDLAGRKAAKRSKLEAETNAWWIKSEEEKSVGTKVQQEY